MKAIITNNEAILSILGAKFGFRFVRTSYELFAQKKPDATFTGFRWVEVRA